MKCVKNILFYYTDLRSAYVSCDKISKVKERDKNKDENVGISNFLEEGLNNLLKIQYLN